MKACSNCGVVKALQEFARKAKAKDGYAYRCKACTAADQKAYREANADAVKARKKAARLANAEKQKAKNRAYYEANKAEVAAKLKAWAEANPDKVQAANAARRDRKRNEWKAYRAQKYRENLETAKKQQRAYYEANAERVKEYHRQLVAAAAPSYVASLMQMPVAEIPEPLLRMKQEQITLRRLARQLKEAAHESSKDTDRITGQHGRGGHAGRPAANCGEQPAGAGPQGNQRHGRGGDGKGSRLDQQQLER